MYKPNQRILIEFETLQKVCCKKMNRETLRKVVCLGITEGDNECKFENCPLIDSYIERNEKYEY